MQVSFPTFLPGNVNKTMLLEMLGPLQMSSNLTPDGKLGMQKLILYPVVVSTIQTSYWKIPSCGEFYAMKQERSGSVETIAKFTR